ncbi:uncharacterized protein [Narcine bancroftii]|uniref:uncharacterized protein n=1 Tax=Narcine bancroftii TaxID=1343680 RepID=UPI00383114E3
MTGGGNLMPPAHPPHGAGPPTHSPPAAAWAPIPGLLSPGPGPGPLTPLAPPPDRRRPHPPPESSAPSTIGRRPSADPRSPPMSATAAGNNKPMAGSSQMWIPGTFSTTEARGVSNDKP